MENRKGRPPGPKTERVTLRVPVSDLVILDHKRVAEHRSSLTDTIRAIISEAAEEFLDEHPELVLQITGGKG
jgi:hypothetical protein